MKLREVIHAIKALERALVRTRHPCGICKHPRKTHRHETVRNLIVDRGARALSDTTILGVCPCFGRNFNTPRGVCGCLNYVPAWAFDLGFRP